MNIVLGLLVISGATLATVAAMLTAVNGQSPQSVMRGTDSAVMSPPPRNGSYGSCL